MNDPYSSLNIKNWGYILFDFDPVTGRMTPCQYFARIGHIKNSLNNAKKNVSYGCNNQNILIWDVHEAKQIWMGHVADYTKDLF